MTLRPTHRLGALCLALASLFSVGTVLADEAVIRKALAERLPN